MSTTCRLVPSATPRNVVEKYSSKQQNVNQKQSQMLTFGPKILHFTMHYMRHQLFCGMSPHWSYGMTNETLVKTQIYQNLLVYFE